LRIEVRLALPQIGGTLERPQGLGGIARSLEQPTDVGVAPGKDEREACMAAMFGNQPLEQRPSLAGKSERLGRFPLMALEVAQQRL
jgi:hypothetical protein